MYYVGKNGQQTGPFSIEQLKEQLANGQLGGGDLVWTEGMANWIPANTLPGLASGAPVTNPYPQPPSPYQQQPPAQLYAPPQAGGQYYGGQPISNYLWQSIVVTLLCCLPFGIVAIVYASGVDGKVSMGDIPGAQRASNSAKNWCIAAVVTSLVAIIAYFIFVFAVVGGAATMKGGFIDQMNEQIKAEQEKAQKAIPTVEPETAPR